MSNLSFSFALEPNDSIKEAVRALSQSSTEIERGAVFTKPEVVNGILDLCGYTSSEDLLSKRLLEPSAGGGEFLFAAMTRLFESCSTHHHNLLEKEKQLTNCIFAIELHKPTFLSTKQKIKDFIEQQGFDEDFAERISCEWIVNGDFLLTPIEDSFDVVVGNPPYVRQERIPKVLLDEYRSRFSTLYDRADLYVLFYERCLDSLKPDGVLGFICSNRWVKNKYGGPLRSKITKSFNLDVYIDLEQVDAFYHQVDAYPAITIISRSSKDRTLVFTKSRNRSIEDIKFEEISSSPGVGQDGENEYFTILREVGNNRDPWLLDAPEILATIRELEHSFPTVEEDGCKIGIGVATGADKVFIGQFKDLAVEKTRKIPLLMSGDLKPTGIEWSGCGIVNPWLEKGGLASLEDFPKFADYLKQHEEKLRKRHVARKTPQNWYKTIDRIYPVLTTTPKLLIPDIKGGATVVYDEGKYYPHHNLYVVTSDVWDLCVLQAVLKSSVALAFVAAYCVRMSGGFLRFQAQYLRRIRIPKWESLSFLQKKALAKVGDSQILEEIDHAVFKAYNLTESQANQIRTFAASARVGKK